MRLGELTIKSHADNGSGTFIHRNKKFMTGLRTTTKAAIHAMAGNIHGPATLPLRKGFGAK
jgi:hypothetical protein